MPSHVSGQTERMMKCAVSKRPRVMILDQDWHYGIGLADRLAAEGFHPVLVRSVDAAVFELHGIRPQAVVLALSSFASDVQLRSMNVMHIIETACPGVPVLTVTDAGQPVPLLIRCCSCRCLTRAEGFAPLVETLVRELRKIGKQEPAFQPVSSWASESASHEAWQ